MKLYYSPGTCSQASHIALREAGLPFDAVLAPTKTKVLPDGSDYRKVNPLGYVPLLELDDGTKLTESPAILMHIADQAKGTKLAPPEGTIERYQVMSWLAFVSTELHKGGFGVFFNPAAGDDMRNATRERLEGRLQWLDGQLAGKQYLTGDDFTVADAYLFVTLTWANSAKVDLAKFPNVLALRNRVAARESVKQARKVEGLPAA